MTCLLYTSNIFPTKGNLIMVKNSLELAKQGYELMDKKRNILIRELMNLNEEAKAIQSEINDTFTNAYEALQQDVYKRQVLCSPSNGILVISFIRPPVPFSCSCSA